MEGESASALTALPAGQPPQAAKCSRGEGNQRATYPFYPFGLAHTHTHTANHGEQHTHTHVPVYIRRTCELPHGKQGPSTRLFHPPVAAVRGVMN